MLLATNLINVGMPYIATFLPTQTWVFNLGSYSEEELEQGGLGHGMENNRWKGTQLPRVIPLRSGATQHDVSIAREELKRIVPYISWEAYEDMQK